jgi:hypothetical protein
MIRRGIPGHRGELKQSARELWSGTDRIWSAAAILGRSGGRGSDATTVHGKERKRPLHALINRALVQLGYIPLSEVHGLLGRISERMSQIDEPLAREYVLNPFPGGIEQKIHQLCVRRKSMFDRLAESELQAERKRLAASEGRENG